MNVTKGEAMAAEIEALQENLAFLDELTENKEKRDVEGEALTASALEDPKP